mgnify:CR=1 FL=1
MTRTTMTRTTKTTKTCRRAVATEPALAEADEAGEVLPAVAVVAVEAARPREEEPAADRLRRSAARPLTTTTKVSPQLDPCAMMLLADSNSLLL